MPDANSPFRPAEEIREALERILTSADFSASERNRRFLRYVVEETLSGRADRIKGYSIAVEVFERDESFDPQVDPIVRIEAGRLRRSLDPLLSHRWPGRRDPHHRPEGHLRSGLHRQGSGATDNRPASRLNTLIAAGPDRAGEP